MADSLQQNQQRMEEKINAATEDLQTTVAVLLEKNKQLEEARRAALAASQEKATFLARMSHEIRTPLSAVIGFSRLLHETEDSVIAQESIRVIKQTAKQLLCVVDDILNFSRLEAGSVVLESIEFDLPTCLENVIAMMSPAAHEKGLELVLHLHGNFPRQVVGDPTRLSQVLTNLISNAIKFTTTGHVFVEGMLSDDAAQASFVSLSVQDTGEGMSEAEMGTVFEAFNQADSSITRRYGGTGLGLPISKRLVEVMGGRIHLQSEKAKGTSFYLEIPFACKATRVEPEDCADLNGKRVLLYEPHHLSRRALRATLAGWGMQVFNTGDEEACMHLLNTTGGSDADESLLIIGFNPHQYGEERLTGLAGRIRLIFGGPVLLLVGAETWQLPAPLRTVSKLSWASKPIRGKLLFHRITELLDLAAQQPAERLVDAGRHPLQSYAGKSILAVEDNEFNRLLLCRLLRAKGAFVDEAVSGEVALTNCWQQAYDLIFMDLHMPGIGGIEAARRIRSQYGDIAPPIVALSADVFAGGAGETPLEMFDEYLIKPISAEALDRIADRWLQDAPSKAHSQTASLPAPESPPEQDTVPEELRGMLHAEILRLRGAMQAAMDNSNWRQLKEIAHQFRGLVGIYGMHALKDRSRLLEKAAEMARADTVRHHFQHLNLLIDTLPTPTDP
jgi:two-component system sensor histidine kinase BarA